MLHLCLRCLHWTTYVAKLFLAGKSNEVIPTQSCHVGMTPTVWLSVKYTTMNGYPSRQPCNCKLWFLFFKSTIIRYSMAAKCYALDLEWVIPKQLGNQIAKLCYCCCRLIQQTLSNSRFVSVGSHKTNYFGESACAGKGLLHPTFVPPPQLSVGQLPLDSSHLGNFP